MLLHKNMSLMAIYREQQPKVIDYDNLRKIFVLHSLMTNRLDLADRFMFKKE
jgi:hypothetical protein